jgi:Flp pilus assembly protein TadG
MGKPMKSNRRGVAAVEAAFCMPLFVLLTLGMIELGRACMVEQVVANAAREGAYYASGTTSTTSGVQSAVTTYLTDAQISTSGVSIVCSPSDPSTATANTPVSVTVSIPFKNVSWLPAPKYVTGNLSATVVFPKSGVAQ